MKNYSFLQKASAIAVLLVTMQACDSEQPMRSENLAAKHNNFPDVTFYALASGNMLEKYSTSDPESVLNSAIISGLAANESILAIDFRPATGQMYGLGSNSRLYVIDPDSGAARVVGNAAFSPALEGNVAGFDFNPTVDRIRLVTDTGQNLRLNPETGTVAATDLALNGVTGAQISGAAYTDNFAGTSITTLYDIDVTTQKLYKQLPPNNGTLVEVGDLDLKVVGEGGFDISPDGVALAMYEVNKKVTLFTVDLVTGHATIIAKYNKSFAYTGIAIPTRPVAYAVTGGNMLQIFNPQMPGMTVAKNISGLASGETVMGIDFRPATGQLYALGSTGKLYSINASSGAAATVAMISVPLSGTDFGFDFNPVVDRIRIVSNTGQNLRVNPTDGVALTDGALYPMSAGVSAAAYSNNFAGTTSTTLYDIDVNSDMLYQQNPPNNGTLVAIGSLGINANSSTGFDIGGKSGIGYAIMSSGTSTALYKVNTASGLVTSMGSFAAPVNGFTVGLGF